MKESSDGTTRARAVCKGVTRAGAPCRQAATRDGLCRRHAATPFYARILSARERESYEEALAQEGLEAEVAVLRLHVLRLLGRDDPARPAEIPRAVQALARTLRDTRRRDEDPLAVLDEVIRAEGRRWLDDAAAAQDETGRE